MNSGTLTGSMIAAFLMVGMWYKSKNVIKRLAAIIAGLYIVFVLLMVYG